MASSLELAATDPHSLDPSRSNGRASNLPPALDKSHSFAGTPFWHRSAPRRLVAAQHPSTSEKAWREWQRHLASRKAAALPAPFHGKPSPLVWGLPPTLAHEVAHRLAELRSSLASAEMAESFISEWTGGGIGERPNLSAALESIGLVHMLPRLATICSDALWWKLCDWLHALAADAQRWALDWENDPATVTVHQLLAGELAFDLGFHFPEVAPLRALRKASNSVFSEALVELLDGEGLLRAGYLSWWRPLFACWTRAALMAEKLRKPVWTGEAQTQYEWLVRQSITFSRPDGSLILSDDDSREWSPELFRAALDLAGDDSDCAAAEALLSGRIVPVNADFDEDDLPEPSVNSEWSGLTLMATRWSKAAVRVALSYTADPLQLELAVGRDILCRGNWEFELLCDGKLVSIKDDEWEELCWQSDEDCDFLELAVDLDRGIRLERQLLLARDDAVLYLADYVHSEGTQEYDFEYRMHLPLGPRMQFVPESETRDGLIVADRPLAAVLPLALPEWRCDPRGGELVCEGGRISLHRRHRGKRLACPLFFDFRQRRLAKERTWRQLTVAEQLEIQPPDVAVGYRAQSGKDQWLFYRSLAQPANRTLLGQNTAAEFFAGRFLPTGEVDEFVEIETIEE